ncbi:DUF4118 domain-containing protein, partial [Ensifer sp. ENS01]|nr:DUF4118 domain-containing protein [Ensifer sp. ENS01]
MMLSGRTSLMRGFSDRVFRGSSSPAKAHGFAATTVLIAFLLRYFLMGVLDDRAIYILFVPPVLLAAAIGGIGPGILAVIASIGSAAYLRSLTPGGVQIPELVVFTTVGVAISFLGEMLLRAQH